MRRTTSTIFQTAIGGFIAVICIMVGASGVVSDVYYRLFGRAVQATTIGEIHDGHSRAIIAYAVSGKRYKMISLRGSGSYEVGDTEIVRYLPDHPEIAKKDLNLGFFLSFIGSGVVVAIYAAIVFFFSRRPEER